MGLPQLRTPPVRVLIVSENISMQMGGESSLPYYYAKLFQERNVEIWLVCHERVETEVRASFADIPDRLIFIRDSTLQKLAFRWSQVLPYRIRDLFVGQAIHLSTQIRIRKIARDLAKRGLIDVVLEPAPITPKGISFMYDIGVPVAIGPMCGGMNFPPAFVDLDSKLTRMMVSVGRHLSQLAATLVPGKLRAKVLMVANESTLRALPRYCAGQVVRIFESGVDLNIWRQEDTDDRRSDDVHFVFSGRFVDWKGVQYLVNAFALAAKEEPRCRLDLIGGGEYEQEIRAIVSREGIESLVRFHGWRSRAEAAQIVRKTDVFVMPSLRECGGTAILEAMALGKPVIVANWGGPADYVNPSCGILVDVSSKEEFVTGLSAAIVKLTRSAELRKSLGGGGKVRVREDYLDWSSKADRVLEILNQVTSP
jgi:glycosyltransferase involved in cell wall biosynthesis